MKKEVTRILIESILNKTFRDIQKSPRRTARNLVDMGVHFAKGPGQKAFLSNAQEMLQKPTSAYYDLITDLTSHVDKNILFTFGMNLGYNGCTKGTKMIRQIEREKGFAIPWSLSFVVDADILKEQENKYQNILDQGKKLGIYVYALILVRGSAEDILPLVEQNTDCAFNLFLQDTSLSSVFLNSIRKTKNVLLSVQSDVYAEENCRKMREHFLLYGIHTIYNEKNIKDILDGTWIEEQKKSKPHFLFLFPHSSCSSQMQQVIYQYILHVRKEQKDAVILMELGQDLWKINQMISDQVCLIGFHSDGRACIFQQTENDIDENIFQDSIEHILRDASRNQ